MQVSCSLLRSRLRYECLQLFDEVIDGEAGSTCAGDSIGDDLAQLPLALDIGALHLLTADEGAGALVCFEHSAQFQLPVSAHNRIGIDGQIDGELSHGRQLVSGVERTRSNRAPHLVNDLAIDGDTGVEVKKESEGRNGLSR